MRRPAPLRPAILLATTLLVAACAGTGGSQEAPGEPTVGDTGTSTTTSTPDITDPPPPAQTPSASSMRELLMDGATGTVILQPADEGGSHPTLTWSPLEGASTYWLVLRDGSGRVAWAWSGDDTSVRVGGGDTDDLNQTATAYEEMTWSVLAFDAAGELIGLSDRQRVAP